MRSSHEEALESRIAAISKTKWGNFVKIPYELCWKCFDLSHAEFRLYAAYQFHTQGGRRHCYAGLSTLTMTASMNKESVTRCRRSLENKKLIQVIRDGDGKNSRIVVLLVPIWNDPERASAIWKKFQKMISRKPKVVRDEIITAIEEAIQEQIEISAQHPLYEETQPESGKQDATRYTDLGTSSRRIEGQLARRIEGQASRRIEGHKEETGEGETEEEDTTNKKQSVASSKTPSDGVCRDEEKKNACAENLKSMLLKENTYNSKEDGYNNKCDDWDKEEEKKEEKNTNLSNSPHLNEYVSNPLQPPSQASGIATSPALDYQLLAAEFATALEGARRLSVTTTNAHIKKWGAVLRKFVEEESSDWVTPELFERTLRWYMAYVPSLTQYDPHAFCADTVKEKFSKIYHLMETSKKHGGAAGQNKHEEMLKEQFARIRERRLSRETANG